MVCVVETRSMHSRNFFFFCDLLQFVCQYWKCLLAGGLLNITEYLQGTTSSSISRSIVRAYVNRSSVVRIRHRNCIVFLAVSRRIMTKRRTKDISPFLRLFPRGWNVILEKFSREEIGIFNT